MILVTGATGTTGSEVIRQLLTAKAKVRGMVHDRAKGKSLEAAGAEVAVADYDQPEQLARALSGVEKAYLVAPSSPRQAEMEGRFVEAAKKAGIAHLVKLSVIGADPASPVPFMRSHHAVEEKLKSSGLAWTMLRPNGFMSNALFNAASIKAEGRFYSPLGDAKVSYVDVRDIAAVAARTLTERGHEGKTYVLTGPAAISDAELAAALTEAVGRQVGAVKVGLDQARGAMVKGGMTDWYVDALIRLQEFYIAGAAAVVSPDVQKVTGKAPRSFRQWAADHAQAFR